MAKRSVLLDACVLYPAPLRDFLMHLSLVGIFQAKWSDKIQFEWIENLLIQRPDLTRDQLMRTKKLMEECFPDAVIVDYAHLEPTIKLPDPDDHHVMAAAIKGRVDAIITHNLKDFPDAQLALFDLIAIHPDEFVVDLFEEAPGLVCAAAQRHRSTLKKPPKKVGEYLDILAKQGLIQTVVRLIEFEHVL